MGRVDSHFGAGLLETSSDGRPSQGGLLLSTLNLSCDIDFSSLVCVAAQTMLRENLIQTKFNLIV